MRCPKCGYNSFDHLDSCKKCGKELLEYKQRYGIKSVLFPGQMKPSFSAAADVDSSLADAAVAAAAVPVTGSAVAAAAAETLSAETSTSEADDFGFDFMGESEEEDDLSFDELFEEAPVDEDVEEALPSPSSAAEAEADATEFSFDRAEDVVAASESVTSESDLDSDFGFDLDDPVAPVADAGAVEDFAADDFQLPLEDDEDFDFNPDEAELGEPEDDDEEVSGTKGDPKDPFELPESSQVEEAPEQNSFFSADQGLPVSAAAMLLSNQESELTDVDSVSEETQSEFHDPFAEDDALPLAEVNESLAEVLAEAAGRTVEPVAENPPQLRTEAEPAANSDISTAYDAALLAESEALAPPTQDDEQPEASLLPPVTRRVSAFICDLLLLSSVAVSFIVAAETAMSGSADRLLPSLTTLIDLSIPYFLVLFSLAFGYFTLFHFLVGQTPGKMLVGLRVETLDGEPLILSQAFLRSVGGLLQLLPVGLGYLVALLSADQRGWNDRLAGTRLIFLKAD